MSTWITKSSQDPLRQLQGKKKNYATEAMINDMLSAINIVQIMEDVYGLELERQPKDEYRGCCPFPDHRDSSPSFDVNEAKGLYKCWGCGRAGSLLTFIMQIDGLEFPDALEKLSVLSGVDMGNFSSETFRVLYDIDASINEYLSRYAETDLPAGMSKGQFMLAIAQRMHEYEEKVNKDPEEIKWVDLFYRYIDKYESEDNHKEMTKMWKKVGSILKERLKSYKEKTENVS